MDMHIARLQTTHQFLSQRTFYSLFFSSLIACSILIGRFYLTDSHSYLFLVWNLFLAWIPYGISLCIEMVHQRHPRDWWRLVVPGFVWLIFLPNAPYIVTDFVHFQDSTSFAWWYDIGLLTAFAWSGCFLAVASLNIMHTLVKTFVGNILSWLFLLSTLILSGLGVYMGRFMRWNSWNLLTHPDEILSEIVMQCTNPYYYRHLVGVTMMFAALLLVCYFMFTRQPQRVLA